MSSSQPRQKEGSKRQLRILSLDAGGLCSMATITILRHIMDGFNADRPTEEKLEPWQVFDMMGGAGTGGLIALMLGRLQMSLDQCEESFHELCRAIYKPRDPKDKRGDSGSKFDSAVMAKAIRDMLRRKEGLNKDINLLRNPDKRCRVFVVLSPEGTGASQVFSTYPPPNTPHFKLWEVCAATTATAFFFDPVKVTDDDAPEPNKYYRAKESNPFPVVELETHGQWGGRDNLIISIGPGFTPMETRPGNYPSQYDGGWLSRFDMDEELENHAKVDPEHQGGIALVTTTQYMDRDAVKVDLEKTIDMLRASFSSHRTQWDD